MNVDLICTQPGALKPRAQAVLCALRQGPLSDRQLQQRIGDESTPLTVALCSAMCNPRDPIGILIGKRYGVAIWYLAPDGIAWLETNGLSVASEARL